MRPIADSCRNPHVLSNGKEPRELIATCWLHWKNRLLETPPLRPPFVRSIKIGKH